MDLGGGCRGAHPPLPETKPSSLHSLLKFTSPLSYFVVPPPLPPPEKLTERLSAHLAPYLRAQVIVQAAMVCNGRTVIRPVRMSLG